MNRYEVQLSNQLWIEIEIDELISTASVIKRLKNGTWFRSEHGGYINPMHVMQVRPIDA